MNEFRSDVAGRPEKLACDGKRRITCQSACQTEIGDGYSDAIGGLLEHHIAGFQITVDHTGLVGRIQRLSHLLCNRHRLVLGQFCHTHQATQQRLALQQLHRKECQFTSRIMGAEQIVSRANVPMMNLTCEKNFTLESLKHVRITGQLRAEGLKSMALALKVKVRCLVDFTHPSASDKPDDHEPICETVPWLQTLGRILRRRRC